MADLAHAVDYHRSRSGVVAMIEYLLIRGVNDSPQHADALAHFCIARSRTEVFPLFFSLSSWSTPMLSPISESLARPLRFFFFARKFSVLGLNWSVPYTRNVIFGWGGEVECVRIFLGGGVWGADVYVGRRVGRQALSPLSLSLSSHLSSSC